MLAKSLVHTLVIAVVAAVTVPAAADTDSELRTRINRLTPRDLRLRIEVADKKDANTDDKVWVSFNGRSERFYLNHGKIDFKRGDETIYDLPLTHEKIGDLDRLKLGKDGTNGMCVAEMEVTMNDFVVASKSFRNESGGCHWLDNEDGLSRAYTLGSFAPVISRTGRAALVEKLEKNEAIEAGRRDFVLTKKDVEMRLQSSLGHLLQAAGNQVRWGYGGGSSPYAQATAKKDGHDYEVDLDMKLAKPTGIEVDVDLYVDFCDGTKPAQLAFARGEIKPVDGDLGGLLKRLGVPRARATGAEVRTMVGRIGLDPNAFTEGTGVALGGFSRMLPRRMCAAGATHRIDGNGNVVVRFAP